MTLACGGRASQKKKRKKKKKDGTGPNACAQRGEKEEKKIKD